MAVYLVDRSEPVNAARQKHAAWNSGLGGPDFPHHRSDSVSLPLAYGYLVIIVICGGYPLLKNSGYSHSGSRRKLPRALMVLAQPQTSFGYRKVMNGIMAGT